MLSSIENIKEEARDVQDETAYIQYFERPYLESEWAPFYLGHENGVLYAGEWVVRLKDKKTIKVTETPPDEILLRQSDDDKIKISSPEESWHFFINDKLEPLKELGLIE